VTKLFTNLVRPHLDYCSSAWSVHYHIGQGSLGKGITSFTRLLPGMKSLAYRLKELNLWSFEERRNRCAWLNFSRSSRASLLCCWKDFFHCHVILVPIVIQWNSSILAADLTADVSFSVNELLTSGIVCHKKWCTQVQLQNLRTVLKSCETAGWVSRWTYSPHVPRPLLCSNCHNME